MSVRVLSAAQAAALDTKAIAGGVPSRALMQAAGRAAASLLLERFPLEAARGVALFAGPGNNGGDAWVVAAELARRGVRVRIAEADVARTPDAMAEREAASAVLQHALPDGSEGVIVDGLLGTGATGAPRGAIADAIGRIEAARTASSPRPRVVALDVPSGVDATTGETPGPFVRADLTVTFGSVKRGLLVNRDAAGTILVADIGLAAAAEAFTEGALLVDAAFVRDAVPPIPARAHKGTRKRLVVVGGALGMAGATVLAARAAMRSGIGMVRLCVASESESAVQAAEPAAMAAPWPATDADVDALVSWAHAFLIGPGIGATARAGALVERLLVARRGPVVLDADGLRAFEGAPRKLGTLLGAPDPDGRRAAVITPHVVEFARLAGLTSDEVNARRFDVAAELARAVGATVLLKGVPTVVSDGARTLVSASGTPALATAGSGDVLGGILATVLAQSGNGLASAAAAAWVHGRAAEIAAAGRVRGVALDDVIAALRAAWRLDMPPAPQPPVLAELAAVGDRDD